MSIASIWSKLKSTAFNGCTTWCAGEEVVTKESFISICWRLIPYWLNNWEQQWGAECSSMMFELPHFATELLVVLPCVQVCLFAFLATPLLCRSVVFRPLIRLIMHIDKSRNFSQQTSSPVICTY